MTNNDVHHHTASTRVVWEAVGSSVVVLDTATNTTHRLDGELAEVFLALTQHTPLPQHSQTSVDTLVNLGLIHPPAQPTRRAVVAGIAAGGIASLTLPTAVAASSSPSLPVTAFTFDDAFGDWRWQQVGTELRIDQFGQSGGLKETAIFVVGDTWTLTLTNANNKTATAQVINAGGLLLQFTYPGTTAGSYPATLTARLSRNTGTEILQSQEFNIVAL